MRIETTTLPGVLLLTPTPHRDERGLFTRTFDAAIAAQHGIDLGPRCQDSQSRSAPGVLRGLHGRSGAGEAKLVRCARGAILDVIVDARADSPTFGNHLAVELDDIDFRAVWIPAGCLHGFQVLGAESADICYRIDTPHDASEDLAVHWADPDLALPWRPTPAWSAPTTDHPAGRPVVSARNEAAGSWAALAVDLVHRTGRSARNDPST